MDILINGIGTRKVKLDPYLTSYTKTNSICIKYMFQCEHNTTYILDKNKDKFLYHIGVGKAFLMMTQKL